MPIDKWLGDQLLKDVKADVARGLQAAAIALANDVKKELSRPGTMKVADVEARAAHDDHFKFNFHRKNAYVRRKGRRLGVGIGMNNKVKVDKPTK